jgi:hypothetical protein
MAMFGADWRDPNRYDLVINLSRMSRESATRMILDGAQLEDYRATPASHQAFSDLALATRVHATLFASSDVQGLAVEVRADRGHIHIKGRVDQGMEYEVVRLVENVPGVIYVSADLFSVPPEGVLRI